LKVSRDLDFSIAKKFCVSVSFSLFLLLYLSQIDRKKIQKQMDELLCLKTELFEMSVGLNDNTCE